jgi:hypothetical protein
LRYRFDRFDLLPPLALGQPAFRNFSKSPKPGDARNDRQLTRD